MLARADREFERLTKVGSPRAGASRNAVATPTTARAALWIRERGFSGGQSDRIVRTAQRRRPTTLERQRERLVGEQRRPDQNPPARAGRVVGQRALDIPRAIPPQTLVQARRPRRVRSTRRAAAARPRRARTPGRSFRPAFAWAARASRAHPVRTASAQGSSAPFRPISNEFSDVGERLAVSEHRLRSHGGGDGCDQCGSGSRAAVQCRARSARFGLAVARAPRPGHDAAPRAVRLRAPRAGARGGRCRHRSGGHRRTADNRRTPAMRRRAPPGDSPAAAAVTASLTGRRGEPRRPPAPDGRRLTARPGGRAGRHAARRAPVVGLDARHQLST